MACRDDTWLMKNNDIDYHFQVNLNSGVNNYMFRKKAKATIHSHKKYRNCKPWLQGIAAD